MAWLVLYRRLQELHKPIMGIVACEHQREGEHCGVEVDGVWSPIPTCGDGDRSGHGVVRLMACGECRVGPDGCDMPSDLDGWDATIEVEDTGWRHMPWPCATIKIVNEELSIQIRMHDGC